MSEPAATLRRVLCGPGIGILPGVFDGLSHRLACAEGWAAALLSGAGLANSSLGWADVGLLGCADVVDAIQRLSATGGPALLADADTGWGGPATVALVTRRIERAGAAGMMIEDQESPKRCGHMAGKRLVGAEDMEQKVRAAVDARADDTFVIVARTDAANVLGLDEAIERANRYRDAGADVLFADALPSEGAIERFAAGVRGAVLVNMGFGLRERATTPLVSPRRLHALGVAAVMYPRLLSAAAVAGMRRALHLFGDGIDREEPVLAEDAVVSFEELTSLVGYDHFTALEARYLPHGDATVQPPHLPGR